ncbi:MAG: 2-oxo-4-hydroxy-4-carboxy-5-ureidoimidazoline decarboxylase [Vicinamibacterales bacterium]
MGGRAKAGLDALSPEDARAMLTRACGASRWVDRMMARRPFGSDARLLRTARIEWFGLTEVDWLEAFSHHPKIGDRASLAERFPATHDLSAIEQAGVGRADDEVLSALAEANQTYLDRFGFIFIVCATGKTAEEMLALLRARLPNDRATELRIAAEEQSKITALRLS